MKVLKEKLKNFGTNLLRLYKLAGLYFLKFFHKYYLFIMVAAVTAAILVAEFLVIRYPTNDMVGYVFNWIKSIKEVGFTSFWTVKADYSPLFLFFCAIISLLPAGENITVNGTTYNVNYMYYVKGFYFLCIIGMGIGIYLIIKKLTSSNWKAALGYCVTIVLPTVFMNSAIWGNSDVTLALAMVFCLYFALTSHSRLAFLMLGFALGNKLQAVFLLPFLTYLLLNRKLKLYTVIYAFIGLCITFLPSWIFGAPFTKPFEFFGVQINNYHNLTYGCANMWHLVNFRGDEVSKGATWVALALIGLLLAGIHLRRIELDNKDNMFKVAILTIMATCFFLPHMHERYFYIIDVLVVAYAFINKKRWFLVPLMQVSSSIAYYHYLSGVYFIQSWGEDSVHIAAFINLFVLLVLTYDVIKLPHTNNFTKDLESFDREIDELKNNKKEEETPID